MKPGQNFAELTRPKDAEEVAKLTAANVARVIGALNSVPQTEIAAVIVHVMKKNGEGWSLSAGDADDLIPLFNAGNANLGKTLVAGLTAAKEQEQQQQPQTKN